MENLEECKEIGMRIKQLRKEIGISQDDFAVRIGLKQRTLSYMESGDRGILCIVIKNIHKEFKANIEWIIFGKGEIFYSEFPLAI